MDVLFSSKKKTMKYKILLFVSLLGLLSSCGGDDAPMVEEETAGVITTTISEITNITDFEAQVNVSMQYGASNTIIERGVVYGLENNPTVDDTKIIDGGSGDTFNVNLTSLIPANQYFVRSYFVVGGDVSYSGSSEFVTTDLCSLNVYVGDNVRLETQAEVEAFGANGDCRVDANLQIGTVVNDDDRITDVSSLSTIKEVRRLVINNTLLPNVDSLINLNIIFSLFVLANDNLQNLDGLQNVSSSVQRIRIGDNPELQNIDGISGLFSLENDFVGCSIYINDFLENIDGLVGITRINPGGTLSIDRNQILTNVDGLLNLYE